MRLCDATLPSPAENLALEEAWLDACEEDGHEEVLRFWEPSEHFVVVGYANSVAREVNLEFCAVHHIPVLRRCSGGGTVLQGPGCLNYSLILRIPQDGPLQTIQGTNQHIMERNREAISLLLGRPVEVRGHTDLAIGTMKFSGNSQRRRKQHLLFHGSLLLHMDLRLIENSLTMPSKEPDYRHNRSHTQFLMNLELDARKVKDALITAWQADEPLDSLPQARLRRLVETKYSTPAWSNKF